MTPEAELRMLVYQEGQRAYTSKVDCPYTDWRAKTWRKGFNAAAKYHRELFDQQQQKTTDHDPQ
jgi:hypothetical protein